MRKYDEQLCFYKMLNVLWTTCIEIICTLVAEKRKVLATWTGHQTLRSDHDISFPGPMPETLETLSPLVPYDKLWNTYIHSPVLSRTYPRSRFPFSIFFFTFSCFFYYYCSCCYYYYYFIYLFFLLQFSLPYTPGGPAPTLFMKHSRTLAFQTEPSLKCH